MTRISLRYKYMATPELELDVNYDSTKLGDAFRIWQAK